MKAEELMIGDWVKFPIGNDKVVDLPYIEGRGVCASFAASATLFPVEVYKLEPIPLTPEILEKDGFKSWEHGYIWKERIGMGGQTISATSPIEIIIYEGGHSVIMNPHEGKEFQGSIDNVYELQHALKLCGINKEIVI